MIEYVLRVIMLCCRKCFMEARVLMECMTSGWHILQYVVFNWKTCLSGGQVLLKGMYYKMPRLAVWDVLPEYIYFTGGHILQDNLFHRRTPPI